MQVYQKKPLTQSTKRPFQKAVLFDLFGTMVPMFSYAAHEKTLREMEDMLGVNSHQFGTQWIASEAKRISGYFPDTKSNVNMVLNRLQHKASQSQINRAIRCYTSFTRKSLVPQDGVLNFLRELRSNGFRTGLISNCAPEVPALWEKTPFANLFDTTVFSCRIGFVKPSPEIYHAAIDSLNTSASNCIFVGDGSGDELAGAERVGMSSVLLRVSFEDTYDFIRPEVAAWNGMEIGKLQDLSKHLSPVD